MAALIDAFGGLPDMAEGEAWPHGIPYRNARRVLLNIADGYPGSASIKNSRAGSLPSLRPRWRGASGRAKP